MIIDDSGKAVYDMCKAFEEYREEDIIAEDETENQETFEKIKKQDKSNVYDEY